MTVWRDVIGQDSAVATLHRAATDPASMTHAATDWAARLRPLGGGARLRRGAAQGCGECRECRTAVDGSHADVDVIATEGLSIKVALVRDLVQLAALRPSVGRWRIIIIEDADRLTAFSDAPANALLKALEEPTPRTVWILCAPRSRTSSSRSAPDRVTSACAHRPRGRGRAAPAARRGRRTHGHVCRAPPRATSAWRAAWPATRAPGSGDGTSSPSRGRSAGWGTPSTRQPTSRRSPTRSPGRPAPSGTPRSGSGSWRCSAPTRGHPAAAHPFPGRGPGEGAEGPRHARGPDVLDRSLLDLLSIYRDALVLHTGAPSAWSTRTPWQASSTSRTR